jgi:predicted Zn-dependent protease
MSSKIVHSLLPRGLKSALPEVIIIIISITTTTITIQNSTGVTRHKSNYAHFIKLRVISQKQERGRGGAWGGTTRLALDLNRFVEIIYERWEK